MTATPVPQHDAAWLSTATPNQVATAHADGELAELLGGRAPHRPERGQQLTETDLADLTPEQLARAFELGCCDELLGRDT
jgi:hypothetical protein